MKKGKLCVLFFVWHGHDLDDLFCCRCGLAESNVQVVIVVRKGIGGTWALRNAARSLEDAQVLPLIAGQKSLTEFDCAIEKDTSPLVTKRSLQKSLSTRSLPRSHAARSGSQIVRSVSVMTGHGPGGQEETPVISTGSLSDWFASVQNTATQIIDAAAGKGDVAASHLPKSSLATGVGEKLNSSCFSTRDGRSTERPNKATTAFMQRTLKRRVSACNSNATPANIKIHTLSCRLEMFVEESLWKSLDK